MRKSLEMLAQCCPNYKCQDIFKTTLHKGQGKCVNPRCSMNCYRNWAKRQTDIAVHFLESIQDNRQYYRGSFEFRCSSVAEIKNVRKTFMSKVSTWRKRKSNKIGNVNFQFLSIMHCTAPTKLHFDLLAFSTGEISFRQLKADLAFMWKQSGGKQLSFHTIAASEAASNAAYIHKSLTLKRFKQKRIFLPSKSTGLQVIWRTANFYDGQKKDDLWRQCLIKWYGEEQVETWERRHTKSRERSKWSPEKQFQWAKDEMTDKLIARESGSKSRSRPFNIQFIKFIELIRKLLIVKPQINKQFHPTCSIPIEYELQALSLPRPNIRSP